MSKLIEGLKGRTYLGNRAGFEGFSVGKELQLIATQEVVAYLTMTIFRSCNIGSTA